VTGANLEFAPLAVELFVPDVSEAVRFYTEHLGFRLVRSEPETSGILTFALTALGPAVFMFMSEAYYAGPRQHLASGRGEGVDIRVMVDDVDAIHDRPIAAGMLIVHPVADRDYGLRDFIVRDPWGFRLRFASPLR
jgi:catechol 2,3-dioxygenase-like lactoylglutathione lyase family enzyme